MITKMPGEKRNILKDLPPTERSALIGDIITLMTQSPAHTDYKISHISKIVLPPVRHHYLFFPFNMPDITMCRVACARV